MSEIATGKLVIWMRLQAKRITPDGNSTSIMLSAAADRLEQQEQRIAELEVENREIRQNSVSHATHQEFISDYQDRIDENDAKIAELTARAEQAERERDAAKADMKLIVDAVRETHCDDTCCFACKHDCDMSINDSGEFNNECPGFDRDDCFEWRGLPQEGEGK